MHDDRGSARRPGAAGHWGKRPSGTYDGHRTWCAAPAAGTTCNSRNYDVRDCVESAAPLLAMFDGDTWLDRKLASAAGLPDGGLCGPARTRSAHRRCGSRSHHRALVLLGRRVVAARRYSRARRIDARHATSRSAKAIAAELYRRGDRAPGAANGRPRRSTATRSEAPSSSTITPMSVAPSISARRSARIRRPASDTPSRRARE